MQIISPLLFFLCAALWACMFLGMYPDSRFSALIQTALSAAAQRQKGRPGGDRSCSGAIDAVTEHDPDWPRFTNPDSRWSRLASSYLQDREAKHV
jgi:hypothetical protein